MRSNKNAAIFLDRDGTIIEDAGYLKDPSEMVFFPETFKALRKLQDYFLLFVVTNQAGIAKGMISLDDTNRVNTDMVTKLVEAGVAITNVYVCPHSWSEECACIKPKPYFIKKAAKDYHIGLQRSFVVGDHPHDIQLANNVGARGIYVLTGHGQKHLPELPANTEIAAGIKEAAEKITSSYLYASPEQNSKQTETNFILNLGMACHLWWRHDLGREPKDTKQVAEVLRQAGIRVLEVHGGWLACEPRPLGVWEALTGRLPPPDWAKQFDCQAEKAGLVLKLLVSRGIPVSAFQLHPQIQESVNGYERASSDCNSSIAKNK